MALPLGEAIQVYIDGDQYTIWIEDTLSKKGVYKGSLNLLPLVIRLGGDPAKNPRDWMFPETETSVEYGALERLAGASYVAQMYFLGNVKTEQNMATILATRWIKGDSLSRLMPQISLLSLDERVNYVNRMSRLILDCIQSCQERDVINGDLKPENILYDGEVAILFDFGHARYPGRQTKPNPHNAHGTAQYLPSIEIERAKAGRPPEEVHNEHRQVYDISSLADVVFEMLTGKTVTDVSLQRFGFKSKLSSPEILLVKQLIVISDIKEYLEKRGIPPGISNWVMSCHETLPGNIPTLAQSRAVFS
jgi:serine/threonine protein kinase